MAEQLELDVAAKATAQACATVEPFEVAGRTVTPTVVFDTYWRFAAERQAMYQARLAGERWPWTDDRILIDHRFTNPYRAADRVSQYLIRNVAYDGPQEVHEIAFRIVLFKLFNRVSTWKALCARLGTPTSGDFRRYLYESVLDGVASRGEKLYSAAYVIPAPSLGATRKHHNHLRLVERMLREETFKRIVNAASLREVYEMLVALPGIGPFIAYQIAIDLNYSSALMFDEMEFVVAGPGALDGMRKCFGKSADGIEEDVIRYMVDHQVEHFERLGLRFGGLFGRPLQLIDCQGLFCETDKYSRVAHPDVLGRSGRQRIKQRFRADPERVTAWFPPKWNLVVPAAMRGGVGT